MCNPAELRALTRVELDAMFGPEYGDTIHRQVAAKSCTHIVVYADRNARPLPAMVGPNNRIKTLADLEDAPSVRLNGTMRTFRPVAVWQVGT